MNLLFEEDGAFKAGAVLASTDGAYQVELPGGRRSKVKASHVLLHFDDLSPARLLELAQLEAGTIDIDFLWQVAPQQEFGFADLAAEYYGAAPSSLQQAALLLRLHSAPVYFYRKGRGRYRPAPPETLKAALAAVERRRLQDELRQNYASELKQGRAPAVFAEHAITMLVRPDRSTVEVKALEQAADELHTTPLRLMLATGAIASPYRWHVESFLAQHFPRGVSFSPDLPLPPPGDELPLAQVAAFSIDDSATTEIDDAFSVTAIEGGNWRIGIHIAAPALALGRATCARRRRAHADVDGLRAGLQDHDAAADVGRGVLADRGSGRAGAFTLCRCRCRTTRCSGDSSRGWSASTFTPICATTASTT